MFYLLTFSCYESKYITSYNLILSNVINMLDIHTVLLHPNECLSLIQNVSRLFYIYFTT